MTGNTVAVIVGVVIVVLFAVVYALVKLSVEKKRAQEVQAWAAQRGWSYLSDDPSLAQELSGVQFAKGRGHKALNVCSHGVGRSEEIFVDYRQVTQSKLSDDQGNKTTKSTPYTIVGVRIPGGNPDVSVVPQGFKSRTVGQLGRGRVKTGVPQFDRAFAVATRSTEHAGRVFTPEVVAYCLQAPKVPWAISGAWLITWTPGKTPPDQAVASLPFLQGLSLLLPAA